MANRVAAGGINTTIHRWDATTGKPLPGAEAPAGAVTALTLAPDGKLAAAGFTTNQAVLFDIPSGKEKARLKCGPGDAEVLVAFAPDGKALATASALDTIILWDIAGKENKRLTLPERDEIALLGV